MTDDNESNPFLAPVLAAPDDDAPRLIYADWLEEAGDPRGEFIRVQCELDSLSDIDARYHDARQRSRELLSEHGEEWAGECQQDVRKISFRRGFVDNITMRARAFLKESESLFQSVPVNWLRFVYVKGAGEKLAGCETLSRIRRLDLSNLQIPDEDVVALLRSPHLTGLRHLDIRSAQAFYDVSVGQAIAEMESAKDLRSLSISGSMGGETFYGALTGGHVFPKLEHLFCGPVYSYEEAAPPIGGWQLPSLQSLTLRSLLKVKDCEGLRSLPLNELTSLDLKGSRIPAKGIELFANEGAFDRLEELSIAYCNLGPKAIQAILRGDQLANCKTLDLRGLNLPTVKSQQEVVDRLARHEPLVGITELTVGDIDATSIDPVLRGCVSQSLVSLELRNVALTEDATRTLAHSEISQRLKRLTLGSVDITAESMEILCDGQFPSLVSLRFSDGYDQFGDSPIIESTLIQFIESGTFPNLQEICFENAHATGRTLRALAESEHFQNLRRVVFRNNSIKSDDARQVLLSENLPNVYELDLVGTLRAERAKRLMDKFADRLTL